MKLLDLLTDKTRWNQHYWALNANRAMVGPSDPGAVCWCLSGAMQLCYPLASDYWRNYNRLVDVIKEKYPERHNCQIGENIVVAFNDDYRTTYEDVVAVVRESGL